MSESEEETAGRHAAPDHDPNSDPPPAAGEGGEHAAEDDGDGDKGDGDKGDGDKGDGDKGDGDEGDGDEGHGTRQPGADPQDEEEIEKEREERLDPENRPEGVEVDNTDREFDPEKGMFKDAEGYDEAETKFPPIGEQGA